MKKDYTDYKNIPLEQWNSTSFKEYLKQLNTDRFGIPCVHGRPQVENKLISNMVKEHGHQVVKMFIEQCVSAYKGRGNYPTVNFTFAHTYMKEWELPKVLIRAKQAAQMVEARKVEEVVDINYF